MRLLKRNTIERRLILIIYPASFLTTCSVPFSHKPPHTILRNHLFHTGICVRTTLSLLFFFFCDKLNTKTGPSSCLSPMASVEFIYSTQPKQCTFKKKKTYILPTWPRSAPSSVPFFFFFDHALTWIIVRHHPNNVIFFFYIMFSTLLSPSVDHHQLTSPTNNIRHSRIMYFLFFIKVHSDMPRMILLCVCVRDQKDWEPNLKKKKKDTKRLKQFATHFGNTFSYICPQIIMNWTNAGYLEKKKQPRSVCYDENV